MFKLYRSVKYQRGHCHIAEMIGTVVEPAYKTKHYTSCLIECKPLSQFLSTDQTIFKVMTRADVVDDMLLGKELHMLAFIKKLRKMDKAKIIPFAFPSIMKNFKYPEDDAWCLYNVVNDEPITEIASGSNKCVTLKQLRDRYVLAVEAMKNFNLNQTEKLENSNE